MSNSFVCALFVLLSCRLVVLSSCRPVCGHGLDEAPALKVEDVDQGAGQGKGLNIPQIITTPEPHSTTVPDMPLSKLR